MKNGDKKYCAEMYSYEIKNLNDVEDLRATTSELDSPDESIEFDTKEDAIEFVRERITSIEQLSNGWQKYYRCEEWEAVEYEYEADEDDERGEWVYAGCWEKSKPEFTVEFDIYGGGFGAEAVFDNYRDELDELETCETAAEAAGDEDIEFSIQFYNPYPNKPCVPYRPEPLPEEEHDQGFDFD